MAASDLANIGSTISSANAVAVGPTSGVLAAGADEVSTTIAALFGAHAEVYQAFSAHAALFHQQFVQLMSGGAAQYAAAEAENAAPLQTVGQTAVSGIGAPIQALTGGPLIGNGANGAPVAAASAGTGAFGPGGNGAAGQLIGWTPSGGGSFGTGGVGVTGGSPAAGNLSGVRLAGANGGLVGSGGVGEAAAEELGVGGYGGTPVTAAPDAAVTPLAAMPARPVYSPATVRPATPAYSPAAAESAEE
jgi:hypothetical protein